MKSLDLSIIIVSFNTRDITLNCIRSIFSHTKNLAFEIIVVDNNSSDGTVKALRTEFKQLHVISNAENAGFAKANNQGMKVAKGKYILLLNSDTLISSSVLSHMIVWMNSHPLVGISSCALLNADGSLQGTGGYFPTIWRAFSWMFFLEALPFFNRLFTPFHLYHPSSPLDKGTGYLSKDRELDWVTGAFFLVRKEVISTVGYIDEKYFMYVEEVDFCYRAKKHGWHVWYVSSEAITHLGGASGNSEFTILSELKNIQYFYKKHFPFFLPLLRIFLKVGILIRIVLYGILNTAKGRIYAKAFTKI